MLNIRHTARKTALLLPLVVILSLPACSWFGDTPPEPLKGTRISILKNDDFSVSDTPQGVAPQLAAASAVTDWAQLNANAQQTGANADMTPQFEKLWSVDIGDGQSGRTRITARPVGQGGKIFAMDASGRVSAVDEKTGKIVWKVRTRTGKPRTLAGGLAVAEDKLFVTNGMAEVQALSIENGGRIWRTELDSPARSAPTVYAGRLFVTTRGDKAYGMDITNGKILWQHRGLEELAGVLSGASPAVDDDMVLIPYMSGELIALSPGNGSVLWNESLIARGKSDNLSSLHDPRAPPMLTPTTILAANFSTNIVAIEKRLGERVWSKGNGGASQPMTLSGNTVFLLTNSQQLMALSVETGNPFWMTSLLPEDKDKAEKSFWFGPLVLNNQVLVMSARGEAQLRDAATGAVVKTWDGLPPPAENPIVMNDTLYWVTTGGELVAYR